jgi:23S rRNA-/tRNA-specific pseudouridylate synthase
MKVHRLEAGDSDSGMRLDKFLASHLVDISRSRLSQWIKQGLVSVDG